MKSDLEHVQKSDGNIMTHTNRTLLVIALLLVPALVHGKAASDDERGWSFWQRFQGSSNSAGVVLKTSSTAAYSFNRYVRAYAGFPMYFAREASTSGNKRFINGIGNVYSSTPQQQSLQGGVLSTIARSAGIGNNQGNSGKEQGQGVFQTRQATLGPAEIANDHGFSAWLTVRPTPLTDFQIGYSRSVSYQLDSLFFGVGFRVGH